MHTVEGVLIKSKREFNEIKGIRSGCNIWGHCFYKMAAYEAGLNYARVGGGADVIAWTSQ